MKRTLCWAMLAALLAQGAYCRLLCAQGHSGRQGQPAAAPRLALLDVSRVFKNHNRFKGMMEDMKADVQQAENRVKAERDAINKLLERLKDFRNGTPDYKSLEAEIAERQADLEVKVRLQRKQFLEREAKIYYNVYQEIWQATDYFCRRHNIDMVFRFNGEKVDPEQPQSVLGEINKPLVWYDQSLDITDAILSELNRTSATPAAADRRGSPAPRPTVPFGNKRQ